MQTNTEGPKSAFSNIDPEVLTRLQKEVDDSLEPQQAYGVNTQRQFRFALRVFEDYLVSVKTTLAAVNELSTLELDDLLSAFYSSTQKRDKGYYSKRSMQGIRYGIHQHFLSVRNIDIMNRGEFSKSNKTYKLLMALYKKQRKTVSVSQKVPISQADMDTIQNFFDLNSPLDLQDKVFMDIAIIFPNDIGKNYLRDMTIDDFMVAKQEDGRRFVTMRNELVTDTDDEEGNGVMKEMPGHPRCPVASFLKYTSKLHPASLSLWQRHKSTTISNMMTQCGI